MRVHSAASWIVACALLAGAAACEQGYGPTAEVPAVAGTWSGTIVHSAAGEGAITMSVLQRGAGLTGQWSSSFPDGARNQSGTLSATVTTSPFILFLRPATPISCGPDTTLTGTLTMNVTMTDGRMNGPFTILNCAGVLTGTMDVRKQ